jgi:hypothetical protein
MLDSSLPVLLLVAEKMSRLRVVSGVRATVYQGNNVIERNGARIWMLQLGVDGLMADPTDPAVPFEDLDVREVLDRAVIF